MDSLMPDARGRRQPDCCIHTTDRHLLSHCCKRYLSFLSALKTQEIMLSRKTNQKFGEVKTNPARRDTGAQGRFQTEKRRPDPKPCQAGWFSRVRRPCPTEPTCRTTRFPQPPNHSHRGAPPTRDHDVEELFGELPLGGQRSEGAPRCPQVRTWNLPRHRLEIHH